MKRGTDRLLKFEKLQRALTIPRWQAIGLLEALWHFTTENAPLGDVGRFTDEDIALGIDYTGDPGALVGSLVQTGWLDRADEHRLVVHDWHDHAPDWLKKRLARSTTRFASDNGSQRQPVADNGSQRQPSPAVLEPPTPSPSPSPSPRPSHNPREELPPPPLREVGQRRPKATDQSDGGSTTAAARYLAATDQSCQAAWNSVPRARRRNVNAFRDAWVEAMRVGADPPAIADGLVRYYASPEGCGGYARAPATFVREEGWLEDESAWQDRDAQPKARTNPMTGAPLE